MNFGYREACLAHETGDRHPESADRLRAVRRGLADCHAVEYTAAPDVDPDRLRRVHDPDYVDSVREFCEDGGGDWDGDTVAVAATWDAAVASAGLAEWTAETALRGADGRETPFSLGRPPGHHAVADDAMGFCFFNNAAVGARAALEDGADRVAVVDWDVHHGNGTQDIFYDRDDVFYASVHEAGLFPGTGALDQTGSDDAPMTTLNAPLPPGSDTVDYLAVFDDVLCPALRAFDPDLVLVSAGFDAHEHDPISRMRVSTEGFGSFTERLRDLATDRDAALGFVLEGGYGLDTLTESVTTVHEVFDGYRPTSPDGTVGETVRERIDALREHGFGED